ncbi:uncharacterized protein LOC110770304 [Prunus avium]|uniref:Uncharacterized protein LOC110770304 n=1 Tax=Prunus avium TaxID=42229 RepID=A0A6P5TTB8_PRUAV|nr:uncharacterized protein LOC110770304 [Prunus avium]
MRGPGYDGASNMRGAWNGLQALFLRDCPYAYYVHCFAYILQLALVAAAKDVAPIWLFFSTLNSIINLITASPKRHGELQSTQATDIAHMLDTGERETGRGANQIGTLHRPGATRWGSHYDSVSDLIEMYNASCSVIETLIKDGATNSIHGEATDTNALYKIGTSRSCQQRDDITVEHHYRVDLFNDTIYYQLEELNTRFSKGTIELLTLSSALDPSNDFKAFKIDDICKLVEKFYPRDFTSKDLRLLRYQLELFESKLHLDIFQNMSTLFELCQRLTQTIRAQTYYLINRMISLVLTLPVSTVTIERAFSAMKHIKIVLRNKMENEYLTDSLIVYIEKELSMDIDSYSIITYLEKLKERRVLLH